MIYDYVNTKPPLNEETLAHYGVKGMKWKNHIYNIKKSITTAYDQYKKGLLGKRIKAGVGKKYLQTKFTVNGVINKVKKNRQAKELSKKAAKYNSEKGRKQAYKARKNKIVNARANAKAAYDRGDRTSNYYTSTERRKQVKQAKKTAANAYKKSNKVKNEQRRKNWKRFHE